MNKFATVENEFRSINDYIQRSTIIQQDKLRCVLESSKTLSASAAFGTRSTASRPQNIASNAPSICPGSTKSQGKGGPIQSVGGPWASLPVNMNTTTDEELDFSVVVGRN